MSNAFVDKNYIYAVSRIRYAELRLLDRSVFDRLCDAADLSECLSILAEKGFGGDSRDPEDMIAEGREIAKIHKNMVVKIPMTPEGLKAVKVLTAEGIKTNVTLVFSANQALLAARAGATYVSPFLGRLDDISTCGTDLIYDIVECFSNYPDIETQIIAASTRNPMHITECAKAGADIATVPYKVLMQMFNHPLTDIGIEKFKKDYIAVFGE